MTLTPIRIRGKRKRKTPSTNLPIRLQHQPPKKIKRSLSTVLASRESMSRPTLESLPAEILETILLYSLNLALPRCSHVIGSKLSNRATQIRLFTWAFHDTWDQWFGIVIHVSKHNGPEGPEPEYARPPEEHEHVLQTQMLELPWVNIDFILQAQQTWYNHYGRGRWYQHSVPWVDDPDGIGHSKEGGFSHFDARECFEVDYQQALKWNREPVALVKPRSQDVNPRTRMPVELITGPWDDEKQRRLFWLVRGGIDLRGGHRRLPWEVKLESLRNSIFDAEVPNTLVNNCINNIPMYRHLPRDVVRKQLLDSEKRLTWGGDTEQTREIIRTTRRILEAAMSPGSS